MVKYSLRIALPTLLVLAMAGTASAQVLGNTTCPDSTTLNCPDNAVCVEDAGRNVCQCDTDFTQVGDPVTFTCEETPFVTIGAPADGAELTSGEPTFRGTAAPNASVDITIFDAEGNPVMTSGTAAGADGAWNWSVPSTNTLEPGVYRVVASSDLNNSLGAAEDEISITIVVEDEEPPVVTPPVITPPAEGAPDWSELRSDVDVTGGRVWGNCAQNGSSMAGIMLSLLAMMAFVTRRRIA